MTMATGRRKGNLNIIGLDVEDDTQNLVSDDEFDGVDIYRQQSDSVAEIHVFTAFEMAKLQHFFPKELQELANQALLHKEPKDGDWAKKCVVDCKTDKRQKCKDIIQDLERGMTGLSSLEYDFQNADASVPLWKIKKEIEERSKPGILLYYLESYVVQTVAKSYDEARKGLHEIKVKFQPYKGLHEIKFALGAIKGAGRFDRQLSNPDQSSDDLDTNNASKHFSTSDYGGGGGRGKRGDRAFDMFSPLNNADSLSSLGSSSGSSLSGDYCHERMWNGFVLRVYKADITRLDVEVIVNAANDTLMHGGGVARVISQAAGWELDRESRDYIDKHGLLKVGENCVTTAGRMTRYKGVIHAVGPQWHDYNEYQKVNCMDAVYDSVKNVLITCDDKRYKSVAMPAISAGIYGVPKELCADMYVKAAADYSKLLAGERMYPRELHIIDVDTRILDLVKESVERWRKNPSSIDQRKTVPDYLKANPKPYYRGGYNKRDHGKNGAGGHRSDQDWQKRSRGSHSPDQDWLKHGSEGLNSDQDWQKVSKGGRKKYGNHNQDVNARQFDVATVETVVQKLSDETLYMGEKATVFLINNTLRVKIYKGFIDKVVTMDAIVCGTDKTFQAKGFIADALKKAGGTGYEEAFKKMNRLNLRDREIDQCGAGNLGAGHVIHVVMDRVKSADMEELRKYQDGVRRFLRFAAKEKYAKIAVPLIGTGGIQNDEQKMSDICRAFVLAIDNFCVKDSIHRLAEVHVINHTESVCKILTEEFTRASKGNDHLQKGSNKRSSFPPRPSRNEVGWRKSPSPSRNPMYGDHGAPGRSQQSAGGAGFHSASSAGGHHGDKGHMKGRGRGEREYQMSKQEFTKDGRSLTAEEYISSDEDGNDNDNDSGHDVSGYSESEQFSSLGGASGGGSLTQNADVDADYPSMAEKAKEPSSPTTRKGNLNIIFD